MTAEREGTGEPATDRWKWLMDALPNVELWQKFCHQRNKEFLDARGIQQEVNSLNVAMGQELSEQLRETAIALRSEREMREKVEKDYKTMSGIADGEIAEANLQRERADRLEAALKNMVEACNSLSGPEGDLVGVQPGPERDELELAYTEAQALIEERS